MANEAAAEEIISVATTFSEDISWVYMNKTFWDIILNFNEENVCAHKVILATRCKYFEAVLVNDPKITELTIEDVSTPAFKKILHYIYTGSLTLPSLDTSLIFEVLQLAKKFLLKKLEVDINKKLSSIIKFENVFEMLNKATSCDMENLRRKCCGFIDKRPLEILHCDKLKILTQKSMIFLLERDSFKAPEVEIFKAVQKWCQVNEDKNNLVIDCIHLDRLTNEEILTVVFPSKLIENEKLLKIMAESVREKPVSPQLATTTSTIKVENENFAATKHGAQVIFGNNTSWLLVDVDKINMSQQCAFHKLNDPNGITIKFRTPFCINHIKMRLFDMDFRFFSYYIEVSLDQQNWQKIIDYSQYNCRSYQNLYFEQISVQYIRIVGTRSSAKKNNEFKLASFKAFWQSEIPKVINGIVYPKEDIITMGAVFFKSTKGQWLPLKKKSTKLSTPESDSKENDTITFHLGQPYCISSMKFHLDRDCSYYIQTSLDQINWITIVDFSKQWCSSWQNLMFLERPALYLKLIGTSLSFSTVGQFGAYMSNCSDIEIPSKICL